MSGQAVIKYMHILISVLARTMIANHFVVVNPWVSREAFAAFFAQTLSDLVTTFTERVYDSRPEERNCFGPADHYIYDGTFPTIISREMAEHMLTVAATMLRGGSPIVGEEALVNPVTLKVEWLSSNNSDTIRAAGHRPTIERFREEHPLLKTPDVFWE